MPVAGRWLAIVNPVAGNGNGARVAGSAARIFAEAGIKIDVARTPGPGEAARLASAAVEDGYTVIVAVGGDGTTNEVANGLLGTPAHLAMYPVGTGNDVPRNLGYPRKRRLVPAFLARAVPRVIDVGLANGRAFVNHVGIGIDGVVAERARSYGRYLGPVLGYTASSLAAIATYTPTEMRIEIDGDPASGRYLVIVASNGVAFGGGMKAAPLAELDDGWLDLSIAGDLGRVAAVGALFRLYRGTHVNGTTIVGRRARSLRVELEREVPFELDGESARTRSLQVRIRGRALSVLG
ncbi:MAG TPA: diacylglycerol kinase family protein [Candidatus Limnocylindria bacterium]|nr:diacylglycerol kinase family protein [Candidatus Limnocylindria bacterium]